MTLWILIAINRNGHQAPLWLYTRRQHARDEAARLRKGTSATQDRVRCVVRKYVPA